MFLFFGFKILTRSIRETDDVTYAKLKYLSKFIYYQQLYLILFN